jgi:hypothetical protein
MIDLPAPPPARSPASDLPPAPNGAPVNPARRKAEWQAALLALLGPMALWVVGMALTIAVASPVNRDGQCEGIGFGCTLTPRDTAVLLGYVGALTVVPVVTIVNALLLLVKDPFRRRALVATVDGLLATALVLGIVGAAGA